MISLDTVAKQSIQRHYDLSTLFYRILWGPHIHHGLWHEDESNRTAQLQLTDMLASNARIAAGQKVLDVGCGMGASSIHLANHYGCHVHGITLSPVQRRWARTASWWHGCRDRTQFQCVDAEVVDFPEEHFDVVWSIECTEHLFDKTAFFQRAAHWLRPGGRMAICAWLAGDSLNSEQSRQVTDVCEGFFCPSLGSRSDYADWMTSSGLQLEHSLDLTDQVARTWEICHRRVERTRVEFIARLLDRQQVLFLHRFETILKAFRTGAMRYGCFVAEKPASSSNAG